MINKRIWPGTAVLLATLCALVPMSAAAQDAADYIGSSAMVPNQPLQELLKKRRPQGEVYVAVPQALTLGADGAAKRLSCSPQIQLTNSSSQTLEELVIGIRYKRAANAIGSTMSRFYVVKTGKTDTQYFPGTLDTPSCEGLAGEVEVIRCIYDSGESCQGDVRAIEYGAVPLKMLQKN